MYAKKELYAENIVKYLREHGLFITFVESCTGGGLANALTNVEGASDVMKGSFVTYSNEAKIQLGVPEDIIREHSVYSTETAVAMARAGLQAAIRADISVGVTGTLTQADPRNKSEQTGVVYASIVLQGHERIHRELMFTVSQGVPRAHAKEEVLSAILWEVNKFFSQFNVEAYRRKL